MVFLHIYYLWNKTSMFNFTALMWAAYDGFIEIVDHLLLHEGIDINIKNILISKSFMIFKNYLFFNNIFFIILWN